MVLLAAGLTLCQLNEGVAAAAAGGGACCLQGSGTEWLSAAWQGHQGQLWATQEELRAAVGAAAAGAGVYHTVWHTVYGIHSIWCHASLPFVVGGTDGNTMLRKCQRNVKVQGGNLKVQGGKATAACRERE